MARRTLPRRPAGPSIGPTALPRPDAPEGDAGTPAGALPVGAGPLFRSVALDPWRLAGVVAPGLARGDRAKLARELGLDLPVREPVSAAARADEADRIVATCRDRLAGLDLRLQQELATIFAGSLLPEARLVDEALRQRARGVFNEERQEGDAPGGGAEGMRRPADENGDDPLFARVSPPLPALQPTKQRHRVDGGRVLAHLSPGGSLATAMPAYEARAGQQRMARAVAKALTERLHLVVEAGTGTGKSVAYLVPAIEYAVANGKRVVVSTNTINLQEQLFFKDIPLLRRALPLEFRAAVLKGRSNYLCLRRWRTFLRDGFTNDADRLLAAKIAVWLRQTETGDRSELALDEAGSMRWYTQLAADAQHCTAQTCRDNRVGRCFLSRARRRAESAHILVVNHALMLADQSLESKVLP